MFSVVILFSNMNHACMIFLVMFREIWFSYTASCSFYLRTSGYLEAWNKKTVLTMLRGCLARCSLEMWWIWCIWSGNKCLYFYVISNGAVCVYLANSLINWCCCLVRYFDIVDWPSICLEGFITTSKRLSRF